MEELPKKGDGCHQLLDLMVSQEKHWMMPSLQGTSLEISEENKLELRLAPPGGDWTSSKGKEHEPFTSSGHFTHSPPVQNPVLKTSWSQQTTAPLLHSMKESSQPCQARASLDLASAEKKAVPNVSSAQKRAAPAPVVGWPPIRSFRKNLASGNSSKLASESLDISPAKLSSQKKVESVPRSPFVKINMDGVPIGRKVDLKAYDSYEKLAVAVDELFRGLLAAQIDLTAGGAKNADLGGKGIDGSLVGGGEYTLVYEDNEGDRLLVGDVPWQMFVSSAKRLRVLKSSELATLSSGTKKGLIKYGHQPA